MISNFLRYIMFTVISLLALNANAALTDGSVLSFTAYGGDLSLIPADGNGSWFFYEGAGITGISSFDGLIIGAVQTAANSHGGAINGSESPTVSNPFIFSGSTGVLGTTSATSILNTNGNLAIVDFKGIQFGWNSLDEISLYDSSVGDSGIATITCGLGCANGDTYILDYSGHIASNDPSGIGGGIARIHLEGTVSTVPVPASVWIFSSGLMGLIGLARRKRHI